MKFPYAVSAVLDHYTYLEPQEVSARLRYCTFVSIPHRYMYFAVPKAGCTGMKWLLHSLENGGPVKGGLGDTSRRMFIHHRSNVPLPSIVDLDDAKQKHVLQSPDFLRMTIVRNPYDRLISAWRSKVVLCEPGFEQIYLVLKGQIPHHKSKPRISFEEFVQYLASRCDVRTANGHWRRQTDHTFFTSLNFSWVGKLERLSETLQQFQLHLGRNEPLRFEERNASIEFDHVGFDLRLANMISDLYRPDFDTLGYDATAWPSPEQTGSSQASADNRISEDTFRDEVMERNIIISHLSTTLRQLLKERASSRRGP